MIALQPSTTPRAEHEVFRDLTPTDFTLQPTRHITFPGATNIYAVDFSPDGRTAYCLINGQSIDLWAAGLCRWPEVLGGVLALILLVYLLILRRILRRPQTRGQPHCRRCNYNVITQVPPTVGGSATPREPASAPSATCPECGADLTAPRSLLRRAPIIRGRSTRRRLAIPTAAVLVCMAAYAILFAYGLHRATAGPKSSGLWSEWVDDLAEKHQPNWLIRHKVPVGFVMAVDTNRGHIRDRICTIRGYQSRSMRVSPDGRFIAIGDQIGTLRWIRIRSGRTAARTNAGTFRGSEDEGCIVGFDGPEDDPWVYYRAADQQRAVSMLLRWRPRTGEERTVIDEPAYSTFLGGVKTALARRYVLVRRQDGLATLSAPDFMQTCAKPGYDVCLRGPETAGGNIERGISVDAEFVGMSTPLVAPGGRRMFLNGLSDGVFCFDLQTGESIGELKPSMFDSLLPHELAISSDGDRLFMSVHPQSILVRDIAERRWVARLKYPNPFIAPKIALSSNGRWLAAAPFKSVPPGRQFVHELFLFDLTPLKTPAQSP